MKRRTFVGASAALLGMIGMTSKIFPMGSGSTHELLSSISDANKLTPPIGTPIPVAFPISQNITVIDFCGPWEVFQDVALKDSQGKWMGAFKLFTVSEKTEPLKGTAGLQFVPDYTFENAPEPKLVVVGAQHGSPALHAWLKTVNEKTDVTMSVCTGAFQLARAGLLSGKSATTHHDFVDRLGKEFPDINVKRGVRFVEEGKISTAGGLTSGIDLALHIVDRYFGRELAQKTATYMEYQSKAWMA